MAETTTEAATPEASGEERRKTVVVVGLDDSDNGYYALEWTVRHVPAGSKLVVVHAKPPAASVVSFGDPGDQTPLRRQLDPAEKHRADMLVVGSHGYGAIKRALLGSMSDCCAHHAHCSVMIVKQPKSKN